MTSDKTILIVDDDQTFKEWLNMVNGKARISTHTFVIGLVSFVFAVLMLTGLMLAIKYHRPKPKRISLLPGFYRECLIKTEQRLGKEILDLSDHSEIIMIGRKGYMPKQSLQSL